MREEDSSWFSKWEEELPSPEELMPLSQSLITPDLALAFNIPNPHHTPPPSTAISSQPNSSAEFDSPEMSGAAGGGGGDEPARTLKRPRLVWTPQLHKRFVDAVAHLGIKNAVPKTIMQLMSVDGLTRENVASHLQKYRLYLKRMQGISSNGGGASNSPASGMDAATDHLFASSPVPAHFLHPGRPNSDHYLPFVPVAAAAAMQHHHHHQMAVVGPAPHPHPHHHHPQLQHQFRHFGNSPPNGQFEQHPFLRQTQPPLQRMVVPPAYAATEDLESATPANGKKVLTLFPTGDD
ncbi:PREDICTED: transcription factor PCL1-like isoform X2 [Erythranthe guttata]|uniref:transcription factor PCL1-like isoform X2 n=1 Tax=Erythranthe guttata TaxID=4155 RepID=UPI00064D8491|nr:PREDICTED: transcription factor PCL1-like isoform X2 [Erythranthe guttata]|eukprot:XP_012828191.1 PREDICTED: transcription factor PCL1-like isoform X2 [Erythranthe guttata]